MKKFSILLPTLLTFLVILGMSCEEDPIFPDPIVIEPPVKYTIEISNDSVNGVTIPGTGVVEVDSGDNFSVSLEPKVGYIADSALVNDESWLVEDNEVYLSNITEDYIIKPVWKKDPSFPWLLCEKPWVEEEVWVKQDNGVWLPYTLSGWVFYYLPGGIHRVFSPEGVKIGEVRWYIDQSKTPAVLHTGMTVYVPEGTVEIIEKLNEKNMIVTNDEITIRVILRHPTEEELENMGL